MNDRARRVAVIDDDEDLRELVVQFLLESGFDPVGFSDARAALVALRRPEGIPAAILLDLEMPGMSGWDFRREQLRDPLLSRVPVVVASGAEPSELRAIEADAYLSKPYETSDLCRALAILTLRARAAAA